MTTNLTERLLQTPHPLLDESLLGYILRVAEHNFYDSPHWLLEKAGLNINPGTGHWDDLCGSTSQLAKFLELIRLTKSEFETLRKLYISQKFICWEIPKICPLCLRENDYIQKVWDIIPFTVCPNHKAILINYCPWCKDTLSWERSSVSKCICGYDWRNISLQSIKFIRDDAELIVANRLCSFNCEKNKKEIGTKTQSHSFSIYDYTSAICNLMDVQLYLANGIGLLESTHNSICHFVANTIAEALANWPESFFKFCDCIDPEYIKRWYWYRLNMKIKAIHKTHGWLMIDSALDEYVKDNLSDISGLRLFIDKEAIIRELAIERCQVDQLIKHGHLLSVKGIMLPNTSRIDARSYKSYREHIRKSV